jgi:hypothetical protein
MIAPARLRLPPHIFTSHSVFLAMCTNCLDLPSWSKARESTESCFVWKPPTRATVVMTSTVLHLTGPLTEGRSASTGRRAAPATADVAATGVAGTGPVTVDWSGICEASRAAGALVIAWKTRVGAPIAPCLNRRGRFQATDSKKDPQGEKNEEGVYTFFVGKCPTKEVYFTSLVFFSLGVFFVKLWRASLFAFFVAPLVRVSVRTWDVNPDSQLPRRPLTAQLESPTRLQKAGGARPARDCG